MKRHIKIGFIATSILVSSVVFAKDSHHPAQGNHNMMDGPAQIQKMMDERMEMMKSGLKLNAKQEKAFNTFVQLKKSMMKDMMEFKQARMKGSQMDNMHGKKGMQDQKGMMGSHNNMDGKTGMTSRVSFMQKMVRMQEHAKKLQATSKAGKKFYSSLSAEQKKMLDNMPKDSKGMNMNTGKKR